jgi:hypothetical protein
MYSEDIEEEEYIFWSSHILPRTDLITSFRLASCKLWRRNQLFALVVYLLTGCERATRCHDSNAIHYVS